MACADTFDYRGQLRAPTRWQRLAPFALHFVGVADDAVDTSAFAIPEGQCGPRPSLFVARAGVITIVPAGWPRLLHKTIDLWRNMRSPVRTRPGPMVVSVSPAFAALFAEVDELRLWHDSDCSTGAQLLRAGKLICARGQIDRLELAASTDGALFGLALGDGARVVVRTSEGEHHLAAGETQRYDGFVVHVVHARAKTTEAVIGGSDFQAIVVREDLASAALMEGNIDANLFRVHVP